MQNKDQFRNLIFRIISRAATAALAIAIVFALTVVLTQSAQAQTFKVLYNFTGGRDGGTPDAGLTMDQAGNLYGTAFFGGNTGSECIDGTSCGTVYKLQHKGSNWIFNPLYDFSGSDGANPLARVIFGPDGSLYGPTGFGGGGCGGDGCGTVFNLRPAATACKAALCPWTETVLYQFKGYPDGDGILPEGDLIFDQAGNLYGTTLQGGDVCGQYQDPCGTVFELTPSENGWIETVLYVFQGGNDGFGPKGGLIFDQSGNLYGTTTRGGSGDRGTVFEMTRSGNQWTETVLLAFLGANDGSNPYCSLIFDHSGNLYGATPTGGLNGGGTVFELTPSGGSWKLTVLYSFTGSGDSGPYSNLTMDAAGSLYGTTNGGGAYGGGTVFKLTPSGGGWTYTDLYDFTGGSDGEQPVSNVIFDSNGNLYGTASSRGAYGNGVVWELTP
jgi:uncharacterized repeat protein (TIGR03803 family)